MMNKELIYVIGQMATEKGIDKEVLFEALESALLSASKKTMGVADNARMELDRHTGVLRVFARKKVVESVTDAKLEMVLADAMVEKAVQAILVSARTGKIGDGKIFLTRVDEAIRIRNEERGEGAL